MPGYGGAYATGPLPSYTLTGAAWAVVAPRPAIPANIAAPSIHIFMLTIIPPLFLCCTFPLKCSGCPCLGLSTAALGLRSCPCSTEVACRCCSHARGFGSSTFRDSRVDYTVPHTIPSCIVFSHRFCYCIVCATHNRSDFGGIDDPSRTWHLHREGAATLPHHLLTA